MGAAEAVGFSAVPDFLYRIVAFAPRLIGAVLVLGGGLYLGDLIGRLVFRAADANRIRGAEALMRVTHGLVVIFSGLLAMDHLGIDRSILTDSMHIIVASIGLGCAIAFGVAFGMAGKDSAEKWIRDLTPRSKASSNGEPRTRVAR
jgi:hypothetical protein